MNFSAYKTDAQVNSAQAAATFLGMLFNLAGSNPQAAEGAGRL
jgi:hypothetical protein